MQPAVEGLKEQGAIDAIFQELDAEKRGKLDLEDFMWRMARDTLEDAMGKCGVEVAQAMRKEADRLADKHGGKVCVFMSVSASVSVRVCLCDCVSVCVGACASSSSVVRSPDVQAVRQKP